MFGSSFGASLPSSSSGKASGSSSAANSLFPKSDFSFGGTTSNNNEAEAPSLPFSGFGGASTQPKPSSEANKPPVSGGFNFGGGRSRGLRR